jgi:outer membrane protein assembly factor BamB
MGTRSLMCGRTARISAAVTLAALCMISTRAAKGDDRYAVAGRADWPTFHFDAAHSGANPYENTINASNVGSLVERWSFHGTNYISVAVSGGLLYLYDADGLFALHAKSGAVDWSAPGPGHMDAPTVADGRVFVLNGANIELLAFDAGTGALEWSAQLDDPSFTTSPAVSDGRVFVGDREGTVYAYDAATGTRDWTASTTAGGVSVAPTVADGIVFVTSSAQGAVGGLFALDAATGHRLWRYRMPAGVSDSSPAVVDGLVYVASGAGTALRSADLLAIRVADGKLVWRTTMAARCDSSPAIADGLVYIGSEDGVFHAYDAATGIAEWAAMTGSFFFSSSPAVANGLAYIASGDGVIHAFDAASGEELWHHHVLGYSDWIPSPVVVNGFVYIGSDARMFAFGLPRER